LGIEGQKKLEKFAIFASEPHQNIDTSNVAYYPPVSLNMSINKKIF